MYLNKRTLWSVVILFFSANPTPCVCAGENGMHKRAFGRSNPVSPLVKPDLCSQYAKGVAIRRQ